VTGFSGRQADMISEYDQWDATDMARAVARKDVTPDELLSEALTRCEAVNPKINAVLLIQEDTSRRMIRNGLPKGPFTGVPFLLKDLGCEAIDFPSHNGSRLFANTTYTYDSEIYTRMAATGLVTFGRTTAPEGGIGPVTEAVVYGGPTRNPWKLERTSGGSSGGSGAAVAAGIVPMAHGSDGGGSVRIPASNCGLFGFKATRARLPDGPAYGEGWGGMAMDGVLTRSVRDTALMYDACSGPDPGAPYHAPPLGAGFAAAISRPGPRLRVALCDSRFDGWPIDAEVRDAVNATARVLEDLGHTVEPARPKADMRAMMEAWMTIVASGTALSIRPALKDGRPDPDLVEPVAIAAWDYAQGISGQDYLAAIGCIHAFGRTMAHFFKDYDVLLSATMAEPPAKVGRFTHANYSDFYDYRMGEGQVFDYSPFCTAFNASGQPAASLPLGMTKDGLPIGIHLAMAFGADEALMQLCAEIEAAVPWAHRRPG
jgi:amidase